MVKSKEIILAEGVDLTRAEKALTKCQDEAIGK
jgi:hypothetical protein